MIIPRNGCSLCLKKLKMITRYLFAWLAMVALAILNGAARDFTYGRVMSDQLAHQLSTVSLILVFTVYVWFLIRKWPLESMRQAVGVGALWLMFTVVFEFGMGLFISGLTWEEMLRAYNIFSGNLWVLIPISVAVLPAFMYWIRHTI